MFVSKNMDFTQKPQHFTANKYCICTYLTAMLIFFSNFIVFGFA